MDEGILENNHVTLKKIAIYLLQLSIIDEVSVSPSKPKSERL